MSKSVVVSRWWTVSDGDLFYDSVCHSPNVPFWSALAVLGNMALTRKRNVGHI